MTSRRAPARRLDRVDDPGAALEVVHAGLGHRTLQVAMDGTQKLPQRLLSVLNKVPSPRYATLIAAAWAQFAQGRGDDGRELALDDPRAREVRADSSTAALFGPLGILGVPDESHRALIDNWRGELAKYGAAKVVRSL